MEKWMHAAGKVTLLPSEALTKQARALDSYGESPFPETGVVTYYLPLMAGGQQHGFRLRPLREIGKERYTVYFPIEKTKPV